MLSKPEELVGMLAKPGEFIASAYDFAEHMLSSHRKFAVGVVEATRPLYGGTEGTAAEEDDTAAEKDDTQVTRHGELRVVPFALTSAFTPGVARAM